jgi:hypothetical protein
MIKKFAATLFLVGVVVGAGFAQSPPTLRIVTETPGLPSELFYGNVKVKPIRLRPGTNTPITIADYDFFIQQQYIDFLRRFPEADGLKFYVDILNGCHPSDAECIRYTRGALSANFFRSPEFQAKGAFVMYLYMVSIGQRPISPAELSDSSKVERPHYSEFMADVASITSPDDRNGPDPAKKAALTVAWLQRPEIIAKYGSLTDTQFAQELQKTAGVTLADQSVFNGKTRAQILQIVAESTEVNTKFYIQAFVSMEYLGYLRRDPEDCHDTNNWGPNHNDALQCGYIFHNNRYNQLKPILGGDLTENFIVRGFIESPEYQGRF